MVKHSPPFHEKFFTRERFGRPQVLAGFLLLAFLGQCFWLLLSRGNVRPWIPPSFSGLRKACCNGAESRSPERPLPIASRPEPRAARSRPEPRLRSQPFAALVPVGLGSVARLAPSRRRAPLYWGWLERLPYIVFGLLLGASVWYVARRLYGNAGGYIALAFYCFSPAILRGSTLWHRPEMAAAWGTFGAVFTAIAVAHTLYAPREVVVWNWRRILLLGLSLALAIGCQFSLIILAPIALGFMLDLAPTRRPAAAAIWAAACGLAFLLLLACYLFRPGVFWQSIRHARFFGITWSAFLVPGTYMRVLAQTGQSGPALLLAIPIALIAYFAWRRSRYFGMMLSPVIELLVSA